MKKPICCNKETYLCGANIKEGKQYNIYRCDVCGTETEDLFSDIKIENRVFYLDNSEIRFHKNYKPNTSHLTNI